MKKFISGFLCLTLLAASLPLAACNKNDQPKGTTNTNNGGVMNNGTSNATIYGMLTEDLVNPVGIDDSTPVFSWKTASEQIGWLQSAYQIVVKKGDTVMWDSGKVEKGESVGIAYAGEKLESSTEYSWQVTVWDQTGASKTSDTATFEMGLLGKNAFKDAKWISYDETDLYTGTKYTIDFDFIIDRDNQGFCFGMKDTGTFVMWQVNTRSTPGKVLIRPHFKSNGNWTGYPGGPGNVQAMDVTDAFDFVGGSIVGKTIHQRIEVDGKVIKTYFGADADSLTLASTYTHTANIPLTNIGVRQSSAAGADYEVARFDNIVIRDADGNVVYENDFSGEKSNFAGSAQVSLQDSMLKAGSTEALGEHIAYLSTADSMPAFRKPITVGSGLVSAKLYTAGLGVYEAYVNGERIGRKYADGKIEYVELKPGFTEMADRKFYNTTDITWMLKEGENVLSAVVTNSWWSDQAAGRYGKEDAFLAKLILTYSDGTTETIVTDNTWKTAKQSAVIFADIYTGETYDARVDQSWMKPGYDDSAWAEIKVNTEFKGTICAWMGSPITVREDLNRDPKSITVYKGATGANANQYGKINVVKTYGDESFTLNPGETALVDFGQNFAGWEAFTVEGKAGTVLTIEHGEILNDNNGLKSRGNDGPEGSIYNANYRSAAATTIYTLAGGGKESYHPAFSFYGFRYIEITTTETVTFHSVDGQVVTSVERDDGFIETSDKDVNQLISNIRWGQYSNYLSIPTDCPQRDERMGWTADTQVFAEAGMYMAFSKSFLEKFLTDLRDSQRADGAYPGTTPTGNYGGADWGGTGWADAGIIVPYNLYVHFGDTAVIEENWTAMKKYVDSYLGATGGRGPRNVWGDWLAYESNDGEIQDMLAVAFYAWDALMMAEMAEAIGKNSDAKKYLELYEEEKEYFIDKYVKADGKLKRGEQSVCLYALFLNLVPNEDSFKAVEKQLVENIKRKGNRLQTGFLGTAIILPTLTKIGRSDLAYTLLLQHDNPSWLYSVDQGATTIWERWNSYTIENGFGDVGMNSFNHYAYGAVAAWMFDSMAGINTSTEHSGVGFKRIILAPQPDSRLAVKASYESVYGVIKAESIYEDTLWTYNCSLPANTTGEIRIPAAGADYCVVNGKAVSDLTLEADGLTFKGVENGVLVFEAVSGSFSFVTRMG